jgi:hypothetical protein
MPAQKRKPVEHFEHVDQPRIEALFLGQGQHRASLRLPFKGRPHGKTLCIIGQYPSYAGQQYADKTIHFLERFVFETRTDVGSILMLNLYSRIDTTKSRRTGPITASSERHLRSVIAEHDEFLVVFGQLKNERAYRFRERAAALRPLFEGKTVSKSGTGYAAHPGNKLITYSRFGLGLAPYDFSDTD